MKLSIPHAVPLPAPLRGALGTPTVGRTTAMLAITVVCGPFWVVVGPSLQAVTVGRALLGLTLLSLLVDVVHDRSRFRISVNAAILLASIAGVLAWVGISVRTEGCNCAGGYAALTEFMLTALLALGVATADPRGRRLVLGSSIAGVLVGGLLAALPLGDLSTTVADHTRGDTRLGGVYGNPNFLAFALSFSIPYLAVWLPGASRWRRALLGSLLVATSVLIVLTFSRSGALAALVGLASVLVCSQSTKQRRLLMATGTGIAIAGLAVLGNAFYEEERSSAPATVADQSGWDPSAQGPIPKAASTLSNEATALRVAANRPGEGVSIPIGVAGPDLRYAVEFDLSATKPLTIAYALEDNFEGHGLVLRETRAGVISRQIRLGWRPTAPSPDARFYVYAVDEAGTFAIENVSLTAREAGQLVSVRPLPTELLGPSKTNADLEERYIDSRLEGIELSLDAFASDSVTGIGWERFVGYSAEHGDYRGIPTHNEYVRIAAELGIFGIVPFAILVLFASLGVRALDDDRLRWAVMGILVVGAVGLLFVNGLGRASGATPLAVALGIAWAAAAMSGSAGSRPARGRAPE